MKAAEKTFPLVCVRLDIISVQNYFLLLSMTLLFRRARVGRVLRVGGLPAQGSTELIAISETFIIGAVAIIQTKSPNTWSDRALSV
jgi:hypothetical protein